MPIRRRYEIVEQSLEDLPAEIQHHAAVRHPADDVHLMFDQNDGEIRHLGAKGSRSSINCRVSSWVMPTDGSSSSNRRGVPMSARQISMRLRIDYGEGAGWLEVCRRSPD